MFKGMKGTYEVYLLKTILEKHICGFKDFLVSSGVRFINLSGNSKMIEPTQNKFRSTLNSNYKKVHILVRDLKAPGNSAARIFNETAMALL